MAPVLPLIAVDGLILAFTSTCLSRLIPSTGDKHSDSLHTGICIIVFGIGTIAGGYLSGYLSDKLKIKNAGILAAQIIGANDEEVHKRVFAYKMELRKKVTDALPEVEAQSYDPETDL